MFLICGFERLAHGTFKLVRNIMASQTKGVCVKKTNLINIIQIQGSTKSKKIKISNQLSTNK